MIQKWCLQMIQMLRMVAREMAVAAAAREMVGGGGMAGSTRHHNW